MGNYTNFEMFENPRRGRQARNFTKSVQIVSRTDIFRKLTLSAPEHLLSRKSTSIIQASILSLIWISILVLYLLIISLPCGLNANNISTRLTTLSSLCEHVDNEYVAV